MFTVHTPAGVVIRTFEAALVALLAADALERLVPALLVVRALVRWDALAARLDALLSVSPTPDHHRIGRLDVDRCRAGLETQPSFKSNLLLKAAVASHILWRPHGRT